MSDLSPRTVERIRTRRAGRYAALAFGLSGLCSVGLTLIYAMGGQVQAEGALIGGAMAGLAIGFVLWGKHLMPRGPFVEERELLRPDPEEVAVLETDLLAAGQGIERRRFLFRMLLWALGALGVAAVFPIRSLGPAPKSSLFRTPWRRGVKVVTPEGLAVKATDLPVGGILTIFPAGHTDAADAQAVLIRIDPAALAPLPGRETWSPGGLIAYSKICTHAGCPVGLYEQVSQRLFCPCHQSVFDVLDGARPTAGPATRALPQLPLAIGTDGGLVAGGDFSAPVGPGFWDLAPEADRP